MTKKSASTRRSFLKNGALLAVPLAAAAPAVVVADDSLKARLAKLEGEAAIRQLHQDWLRQINTGASGAVMPRLADAKGAASEQTVRRITPDHAGEPDAVKIAADGKSALGTFHCVVETENPIAKDSTLAQMAHAQGGGFVRRTEHRVLKVEYARANGTWSIVSLNLAPA